MVRAYPNVTFLFHTSTSDVFEQDLLPLVRSFDNVYYTFDWNHMIRGPWGFLRVEPSRLADTAGQAAAAERFVQDVGRVGVGAIVEHNVVRLGGWLRQAPDRIMWGTDRSPESSYAGPVRDLMMEISRRIVVGLTPEHREAYAFRNALRAFGRYLDPPQR